MIKWVRAAIWATKREIKDRLFIDWSLKKGDIVYYEGRKYIIVDLTWSYRSAALKDYFDNHICRVAPISSLKTIV